MRWTIPNSRHWVRRRRRFDGVKVVSSRADIPESTGAYLYVVGEAPSYKWVVLVLPVAEPIEQVGARLLRDAFFWQLAERVNRFAHLLHVGAAVAAHGEVHLEFHALCQRQPPFEVVGHKLG